MKPGILIAAIFVLASCGGNSNERDETRKVTEPPIGKGDGAHRIAQLVGLQGPESARYDPELDVFAYVGVDGVLKHRHRVRVHRRNQCRFG